MDASPTMIEAFRENFPAVPVACESVERSPFFHRSFDGIMAVGLIFLLSEETQRMLISKMAAALSPGGRLLVTAPFDKGEWKDVMKERRSISFGAEQYRALISAAGLSIVDELEDEGENHYFGAIREG
jgi:cyclopropane fatty-acyl-phospholipid synthase-like methyltransferase